MPRIATVVLTTGSLILGMGVYASAAQAAPAQAGPSVARAAGKPSDKPSGKFTTQNGKSKLFKEIKSTGTYKVTADKITVKYKLTDYKKDGWTAGVQFASIEAWDIDDSGVRFLLRSKKTKTNGRGTTPGSGSSGSIAGPPISSDVKSSQGTSSKKCYTCKTKRIKKKTPPKNPLWDGKTTVKVSKAFTTSFTEALFAREVLVRKKKKGKGYEYKVGPLTFIYSAPVGPLYNDDPAGSEGRSTKQVKISAADRAEIKKAARKDPPAKYYPYSTATAPGQPAGVTDWGIVDSYTDNGTRYPLVLIRVRDDKKDKRVAAAQIFYVNNPDDPNDGTVGTYYLLNDRAGRWWSAVSTSKQFTKYMFFRSCVGTVGKDASGNPTFKSTNCGEVLRGY